MSQNFDINLDKFYDKDLLSPLDYHFSTTICRLLNEQNRIVQFSCALLSKYLLNGQICLDLNDYSGSKQIINSILDQEIKLPPKTDWLKALRRSKLVSDSIHTPLVLDKKNRLYLSRYFDFQNRLSENLVKRISNTDSDNDSKLIQALIAEKIDPNNRESKKQHKAISHALNQRLTIISGGPGTGKTHVANCIQQLLLEYAEHKNIDSPHILNLAPTGKAASRMINGQTIHSALKPLNNKPGFFFSRNRQLQSNMVIIDEASMIDLVLLTRLLEAIPIFSKTIILGDQHQLSSVQAGSVFNELCQSRRLADHVFKLDFNFRSKGKSGIEKLSRAINQNEPDLIEQILHRTNAPDIEFIDLSESDLKQAVTKQVNLGYQYITESSDPEILMDHLDNFKILCAHNNGSFGTLLINHLCENILRSIQNFDTVSRKFNQIIMIRKNDYNTQVFNGDTGVIIENNKGNFAYFKQSEKPVRELRTVDLPQYEPAYAITIHKSQGSEYDTVLIIVPDQLSPVLTRELLYTGVTRARKKVIVAGHMNIIKSAINLSVSQSSGLIDQLDSIKPS